MRQHFAVQPKILLFHPIGAVEYHCLLAFAICVEHTRVCVQYSCAHRSAGLLKKFVEKNNVQVGFRSS